MYAQKPGRPREQDVSQLLRLSRAVGVQGVAGKELIDASVVEPVWLPLFAALVGRLPGSGRRGLLPGGARFGKPA